MIEPVDRPLRYDDLTAWLHALADEHPQLVSIESYGTSHEGRDLWLATVTDTSTGGHETKPAHWIDANIHATEVTGGVAALYLLYHLTSGAAAGDATVTRAVRTRTFYVAPRVNPDGVEMALADRPTLLRSSTRPWPWADAHRLPGLHMEDIDGDGRIRSMRIADRDGAWMPHPDDGRVLVPVPIAGAPDGVTRYRQLAEGVVEDFDGFTIPLPRDPRGLDLNRNFPAGWGTAVKGSGDHPLSEPEIDGLVRAVVSRPNVCIYNAFHTFGGVLLRPSSTKADATLPPLDVWLWGELGKKGTELTEYRVHSVFEDFTWDKSDTMSGAADDWAYEHLGVIGWTTEFWDPVFAATGERASTRIWYEGPTPEQELAVAKWSDEHAPGSYAEWRPFDHPQLGAVEIGGPDWFHIWSNPPPSSMLDEVRPHADFAVYQALAAPCIELIHTGVEPLGDDTWRITAGIANTGWLATDITAHARKTNIVLPLIAEIAGADVIGGPARLQLGQLEGRVTQRIKGWRAADGTPERALASWTVRAPAGTEVTVTAAHPRAGRASVTITLGGPVSPQPES